MTKERDEVQWEMTDPEPIRICANCDHLTIEVERLSTALRGVLRISKDPKVRERIRKAFEESK